MTDRSDDHLAPPGQLSFEELMAQSTVSADTDPALNHVCTDEEADAFARSFARSCGNAPETPLIGASAVAKEALSLALGFLSTDNLAMGLQWTTTAAAYGHPAAEQLQIACTQLCDQVWQREHDEGATEATLTEAAQHVGQVMVQIAAAEGEELIAGPYRIAGVLVPGDADRASG
jgi:hypothetical protein